MRTGLELLSSWQNQEMLGLSEGTATRNEPEGDELEDESMSSLQVLYISLMPTPFSDKSGHGTPVAEMEWF